MTNWMNWLFASLFLVQVSTSYINRRTFRAWKGIVSDLRLIIAADEEVEASLRRQINSLEGYVTSLEVHVNVLEALNRSSRGLTA